MRRVVLPALCAMLLLAGFARAQETTPKLEIFGGFSRVGFDFSAVGLNTQGLNGWEVAATANVTRMLGITASIAGNSGSPVSGTDVKNYTALFGPQLSFRHPTLTPSVHALFGMEHLTADFAPGQQPPGFSTSDTSVGMALGGALDLNLNNTISFRMGQVDYLRSHVLRAYAGSLPDTQGSYRFSSGVVLRFGGR